MILKLWLTFAGSFQCQLATDGDGTNDSPTDPEGSYGKKSKGWTYAYKEKPFDRLIRLSKPVDLRTALVDPWMDTKVYSVLVTRDPPPKGFPMPVPVSEPADIIGLVVSLGSAKFDTDAGGGAVTKDAIIDFTFNLGGTDFTAVPNDLPQLMGMSAMGGKEMVDWQSEYRTKKTYPHLHHHH